MNTSSRENNGRLTEPTRLALEHALELISPTARAAVLDFMERKCYISLYNDMGELSRENVDSAFRAFFGSGAKIFMERYDESLQKLTKLKHISSTVSHTARKGNTP